MASPIKHHNKTSSMGPGLKEIRENLSIKAKDAPHNASIQNDKAEEGIQGEFYILFFVDK